VRFILRIVATVMMALPLPATAGTVMSTVPEKPEPDAQYVLHMHGRGVDSGRSTAIAGYRRVVKALSEKGFAVISEERREGMIGKFPEDHEKYAGKIADQVASLLAAGVPAANIAVTGYSRGGLMVQIASGLIANPDVKFVIIAGCFAENGAYKRRISYIDSNYAPKLKGRFLSLRDEDDPDFGSCARYFEKASAQPKYNEIVLSTGLGHAAFKEPRDAWLKPLVDWLVAGPAVAQYRGPIIDAHSQADQEIELEEILALMDEAEVSRTILSSWGGRRPRDLTAFAKRHPHRITPALRTKGGIYRSKKLEKYKQFLDKQATSPWFGAMGEVLLYHAKKEVRGGKGSYSLQVVPPDDPRVRAALALALKRQWPFVAHIEFAEAGADQGVFMAKLEDMLRANIAHPFALIHMGQLEAKEAGRLIDDHPNIYFITSHATPDFARSGYAFTNMFVGHHVASHWKALMVLHKDRFVLGFDNVFARNWRNSYVQQVQLWRRALSELPPDVAHAVAHQNAERLWRLPPTR